MAFMRPEITEKQEWAEVETTAGIWWVPFDVLSKSEAESARRGDFAPLLKYTEGNAVYLDQSSIKKGYGVRLSAPGYMDATEWEVYGNLKEAQRRAKELIEEEDEEGTPAPGHATIAHATKKKSKAQLNREIAEALAGKGTSRGRQHSSISDSDKIRNAIARFPSTFGLRGFPGDVFRISPTSSYVSGERVMLYTERKDNGAWLDFSKGTESELRSEVTSLASTGSRSHSTKSKKRPSQGSVVGRHGLGTADVRTGEGAYWIVTGPTGYRVDYKPWGPSSEVDLGTFSSRRQARAKITVHAGSIGATIVS